MSIPQRQSKKREDVSMREFFERLLEERDRLYAARFEESKTAVNTALTAQKEAANAALTAQKEAVNTAFLVSEKAIIKAEDAQKDYNERSNEFRGQLDDQAKTLMPRPETMGLFKAVDEKLVIIQSVYDNRLEAVRTNFEKNDNETINALADIRLAMSHLLSIDAYEVRHLELQRQVSDLRESRSETSGKSAGANALWGYLVGIAGLAAAVVFHFFK